MCNVKYALRRPPKSWSFFHFQKRAKGIVRLIFIEFNNLFFNSYKVLHIFYPYILKLNKNAHLLRCFIW